MGIYQYKPEAQASASIQHALKEHTSIQAITRLRFGLVLVNFHLPLALGTLHLSIVPTRP